MTATPGRRVRWHTGTVVPDQYGDAIVRLDTAGTLVFIVTAVLSAAVFDGVALWIGAITAVSLFLIGIAAFLWAFYNGVRRSRVEEVSVTQLYLLVGGVAPSNVRRLMTSLLAVQVVTGLATALARPNGPDGSPGSSLALGVLVPMFGLGLNGLWAAYHGTFARRAAPDASPAPEATPATDADVARSDPAIDKNEGHG